MNISVTAALRQFARTIFADRVMGDELVNAVAAEIERKGGSLSTRPVEAFRALVLKWREVSAGSTPPKLFSNAALIAAIGPPPSEARLVLILKDILGLSTSDVTDILSPLSAPVEDLLAQERAAIGQLERGRALIIEDEPLLAADLADLLESIGVAVTGIARTAAQGVELAAQTQPDVVLADYNLIGAQTGLDAVEKIQDIMNCPAIFITGFPEKVLTGERVEPDFVIAKPYAPHAVRAAVAQSMLIKRSEVIK